MTMFSSHDGYISKPLCLHVKTVIEFLTYRKMRKMERRWGILITNDFFQILFPIIFIGRIFGICPVSYKRKGNNVLVVWSTKYCVYSFILAIVLASMTICGIIQDLKLGEASIRMSNDKGKYITVCDMSIVILTVLLIIFPLPFTFKRFWKTLESLNKVDLIIPLKGVSADRKVSLTLLSCAVAIYIYIAIFDIYKWNLRSTKNNYLLKDYGSFYILYFIVVAQELYYCHLLLCIKRRIKSMNYVLYEYCAESSVILRQMEKYFGTIVVQEEKNKGFKKNKKDLQISDSESLKTGLTVGNIHDLSKVHELICEAVKNVNACCGISTLLVMTSCLLHLIVTPYFFLLEIDNGDNVLFAVLQFSWIIAHVLRLLLIIEPCQACLSENQETMSLTFRLLSHNCKRETRSQLGIFAMQLCACKIEFSSCGLVNINRSVMTTIAGAVTTYMVILFQFKDED